MAAERDIETDLALEIDGGHVAPDRFLCSVRSFFTIFSEVMQEVSGRPRAVEWSVSVKSGSSLVQVTPQPGVDPAVVGDVTDAVAGGILQLENQEACLTYFSERSLRGLQELGRVSGRAEADGITVRVWVCRSPIEITHRGVAHVSGMFANKDEDHRCRIGNLQQV